MTSVLPDPVAVAARTATGPRPPPLPDVPARALRRRATRSTRGCCPGRARRPATAPSRQWDALRRTYLDLGHRVDLLDAGAGPAGHGLRGQRRDRRRRHRARRPVPPPERAAEAVAHARVVPRGRVRARRRAGVRQRGRGRPAGRRSGDGDPGRHRLPHRPARPRRGRPRCCGREVVPLELVDPRYYHLDTAIAVLDATTIAWLPEAFAPASQAAAAGALPGRRRRRPGRRRRPRPQRRLRRPARRAARRGHPAWPPRSPSAASSPSPSTCPSCSRAAADRSAARWRCVHDRDAAPRPSHRDGTPRGARGRATRRTTTTRCRSWSPTPRAPGSPTSRAAATSTAWPATRR